MGILNKIKTFIKSKMHVTIPAPDKIEYDPWFHDNINPRPEEEIADNYSSRHQSTPDFEKTAEEVVTMHEKMYRIATARNTSSNITERSAAADAGPGGGPGGPFGGTPVEDDGGFTENQDGYQDPSDRLNRIRRILLYFTDNRNEPRKINVYRALMRGFEYYTGPSTTQKNRQIRRDFISACPRVPMAPISFIFEADTERDVNNFVNVPGFQFAYQNIYKDGLESAISPYSSIAFPPSVVDRGAAKTDNILAHNKCVITIPAQGNEVERVRLLARYGNGVNFIEIDECGCSIVKKIFRGWSLSFHCFLFFNKFSFLFIS